MCRLVLPSNLTQVRTKRRREGPSWSPAHHAVVWLRHLLRPPSRLAPLRLRRIINVRGPVSVQRHMPLGAATVLTQRHKRWRHSATAWGTGAKASTGTQDRSELRYYPQNNGETHFISVIHLITHGMAH